MRSPVLVLICWVAVAAAACETTTPPEVLEVRSDSADQQMFGLQHTVTVDGVLRARLYADTAYLYETAQLWELSGNVTVHFFNPFGNQTSTITSREGTYNVRTTDMEARGDVVGSTPDGRRLTTTILRYESGTDELVGPEAFAFTSPGENMRGDSFRADPDFTRVRATQVRGRPGIGETRR